MPAKKWGHPADLEYILGDAQAPAPVGGESTGARAVIRGGKIEISVAIDALPLIVSGSCCAQGIDGLWSVTDATTFAKEVCHALNDEKEDGTTRVHEMFDSAFMHVIEQGGEGIDEVDDETFEAECSRLQALARVSPDPTEGGTDE